VCGEDSCDGGRGRENWSERESVKEKGESEKDRIASDEKKEKYKNKED
jgi:hypothetical protein